MRIVLRVIIHNNLQDIVEQMTFYDESGYPNLRSFTRYLEKHAENNRLYGYTAVHFNLRHFTLINQEIGRTSGDIAMKNYFNEIGKLVGDDGIVCRVGGDNFVCMFASERIAPILEVMKSAPVAYDVGGEKRVMVSSSAGVFVIPDDFVYRNLGDVMDKVLTCSRAAREGGQESIVYFNSRMVEGKEKVMRVQQLFPKALENGEFKVFYQPKIDIETGELAGAEALCRWIRDGRIVPPMEFIPILEQNTDICKLDFHMLDMVCKDIKRWLAEGRNVVRVSVNLSRKHMMDVDLLEHILRIIDENEVPHKYIEIELTETTTDVEFKDLKRVVNGLQMAGIYTSVDDFGMGYSSLKLIREIPWNVLKVDKSFLPVDDDSAESTRTIMFKYVVAMAKALGLETIAEGVETERQVDVLRDNRCSFAQGFLFDKPLPLNEFEDRLTKHKYEMNK
jgi:diguanylate cyclase (GGDEF)-like protein